MAEDESHIFGTHHHMLRSAISPSPFSVATDVDLRAIQHFQQQTVPALSATFDSDFWNMVVLQISGTEPPVRSAVTAFSSLHECYESHKETNNFSGGFVQANKTYLYGLKQYNIAVRQTAQLLDMNNPASCRVALISCLLFICLELMQDNYPAAITHLTGGLQLLSFCQNAPRVGPLLPSLSSLNNSLQQIFGRMIMHTMFLADTHYAVSIIPKLFESETPTVFLTVAEARDLLDRLFLSAYCFLRLISKDLSHSSPARKLEQTQLSSRLQDWYRLFQEFVEAKQSSLTAKDSTGVVLLEIHFVSLSIMIDTALDKSTTFCSTPAPPFVRITTLVESLLARGNSSTPPLGEPPGSKLPRYSFDLGVIGPLFYTAMKCWNSSIRSKAISLLRHPNIPHREGMWAPEITATLAQRTIDVEEELVSSTVNLQLDAEVVEGDGEFRSETIKQKIWFDIERPTEDEKKLKILVGTKPEEKEERREEVVTW